MAVSSLVPAASGISVSDGNTAGWGNTTENWIQLSSSNITTGSTINFTGLGSYKYYRLVAHNLKANGAVAFRMRVSGITNNTYCWEGIAAFGSGVGNQANAEQDYIYCGQYNPSPAIGTRFNLVFENPSSTSGARVVKGSLFDYYNQPTSVDNYTAHWLGESLTSISIFNTGGVNFTSGTLTLFGAN